MGSLHRILNSQIQSEIEKRHFVLLIHCWRQMQKSDAQIQLSGQSLTKAEFRNFSKLTLQITNIFVNFPDEGDKENSKKEHRYVPIYAWNQVMLWSMKLVIV